MTTAGLLTTPTQVTRVSILEPGSLDHLLFEGRDSYRSVRPTDRLRWLIESVHHHMESSGLFQRIARAQQFSVRDLVESKDTSLVPLISSGTFKRRRIPASTGCQVKECTSSGTRGSLSVVPRDSDTLERFVGTILHGVREFIGQLQRRQAFVIGPPTDEAGDLWFSYSLSLAEILNETEYFVSSEIFDPARLHAALESLEAEVQPVIIAPPSLLYDFFEWMDERSLRLRLGERNAYVITAGGWKRRQDESISREELNAKARKLFGLEPETMRDMFNMVELNTVIFECERQIEHIPPWLDVSVRSPRDLSVLPPGETGVLAYLDPTALSYPAFILSDDLGSLREHPCGCGRPGPTMRIERRLASVEERGCGKKMERYAPRRAEP